jgi:hypothetical protein
MQDGGKKHFSIYDGGEIIIVKNIVFKNKYADHASLIGRPCIVLSEFDDKLTLLPMSSKNRNGYYNVSIKDKDFSDFKYGFKPKKQESVDLSSMFQRDLRYYDIIALLELRRYYRLLQEIEEKRLESNPNCSEYYKDVYQDLEYQRKQLALVLKHK